jgi:hypothetical protein
LQFGAEWDQTRQTRTNAVHPFSARELALLGKSLQMRGTVMGIRLVMAGGSGAEEVEVDAVHGLRPRCSVCFQLATKHGRFRIRKILGT